MTLRRVKVLIDRLPPGSWTEDGHPMSWSLEAYLLAMVVDAISALTFVTLRANGAKSATPPKPLPRPTLAKPVLARPTAMPGKDLEQRQKLSGWGELAKALIGMPGVEVIRG